MHRFVRAQVNGSALLWSAGLQLLWSLLAEMVSCLQSLRRTILAHRQENLRRLVAIPTHILHMASRARMGLRLSSHHRNQILDVLEDSLIGALQLELGVADQ